MRNQPTHSAFDDAIADETAPHSPARLTALGCLFCLAIVIVLTRFGWVQSQLQAGYLEALNVTTTEFEWLPARDGRILVDGTVLAADEDLYSLEVHYRWLEEPVNESWLIRYVRSQLTAAERRNPELLSQVKKSRLEQRHLLWTKLEEVTSANAADLLLRRQQIQKRVARIADDVNRRRDELHNQHANSGSTLEPLEVPENIFLRIAGLVRRALTTTPRRAANDRIVVREEEDFHPILRDVPLHVAAHIRANPKDFPGTRIQVATRRTWPLGQIASHVVGSRTPLNADEQNEIKSDAAIIPGAWLPKRGRSGVEYSWDHRLRGTAGLRKTVRNRRMQIVESSVTRNPAAGHDVALTLDLDLQKHVEHLLDEALLAEPPKKNRATIDPTDVPESVPTGGCVLVMDVSDGSLLAAASAPRFDLSLFTSGTPDEWKAANSDTRQPFLSRITSATLPPGSVFKPVTAAAALEYGSLRPDVPLFCQGYLDTPNEHRCLIFRTDGVGHNDITLRHALAQSCNVYFFRAARQCGIRPLRNWAGRFGFGVPTGIDLPFERSGTLPQAPPAEASSRQAKQPEREALGLAIGQSQLTATPLQVVRMMGAIANGGWLVVPHVATLEGVARRAGDIVVAPRDLTRRRVHGLHEQTLIAIREGLRAAVEQPFGTGYRTVRIDGVKIAGKSGTAETSVENRDHAWFAGYVPADNPKYAFTVVLEDGGSGSRVAGPVARKTIQFMLHNGML
jgi:penicillin-binding protein 2